MKQTSLNLANIGNHCVVMSISKEFSELRSRLFALGVIPGAIVEVLRIAPLGDPMQLKVGGSFISIRKSEAAIISVEIQ